MAAFSSPRSPTVTLGGLEPGAALMKNQELGDRCGSEGAGWGGPGAPSICPRGLQAALPPPPANPTRHPRGAAWGPPKRQRGAHRQGPGVQPMMSSWWGDTGRPEREGGQGETR